MEAKKYKSSPKVALVTGGAKRVGAEICRILHQSGYLIAIHHRNSSNDAHLLLAELNWQRPDSAILLQGDLLNLAVLPSLIQQTVAHFGRLDALINNASSFFSTPLGQIDENAWEDLIGSNLKAPLFLCQAAYPELKKTQGSIINLVDIHAERPMKRFVVYSIAKAGLAGLTKSLAIEMGPDVRVNGIAPGPIIWPEQDEHFDELSRQRILSHTLLKRAGEPADIGKAALFLLESAPFVTGQILAIDGGRSINM